jgi:hypothetical protein
MEPSSELLELLRETRDNQRELLTLTKTWMEKSDRQYQEWQEKSVAIMDAYERLEEATDFQNQRSWKSYVVLGVAGALMAALWLRYN